MPSLRRSVLLGLCVLSAAACERTRAVPPTDSTPVANGVVPPPPTPPASTGWDPAIGSLLLVGGESPLTAGLVSPTPATDSAPSLHGVRVTLLGRSGVTQTAVLDSIGSAGEDACSGVAAWRVSPTDNPLEGWSIGFAGPQVARVIPMDSVETFAPADSAALAATAARLASTAASTESKRFSGLPYSVNSLWRFVTPTGNRVLAATLIRKLNMEASPLEERTLLIAEGDSANGYTLAYHSRAQGDEETVESQEFVAALAFGAAGRPVLVVARDYESAVAYSLIERVAPGEWRTRWTSRRIPCAP